MGYFKKNSIVFNLLLSASVTVLVLGIAELYFRHEGKYMVYCERQGLPYNSAFNCQMKSWYLVHPANSNHADECAEFHYQVHTNNEGLADKPFKANKTPGTVRIMVLGDSFIQGAGAPPDSSCPRQLENILNALPGSHPHVEVWDCGVAGSDPFFEYILLANRLLKYQPDYVIEAVNSTDINDVMIRGGMQRFKPDSTVVFNKPPWFEFFYAHSFMVRRIVHDIFKYDWNFLKPRQQVAAKINSIRLLESALLDFDSLCKKNHIRLLVAFQPKSNEFQTGAIYELEPMIKFCDSLNITNIDIKQCLMNEGYTTAEKVNVLYWPVNAHFNSNGYLRYAGYLSQPVIKYLDSVSLSAQLP